LIEIPDQRGKVARVINTHGNQVADTWVFNAEEGYECMAMEAMRAKLSLEVGDAYVSNHRHAMLTVY
jgi:uncharacterized protein YcgI (DUF1989 family)